MSVTQDYKTIRFSRAELAVILNSLDARIKLADRFIECFNDVTRERMYWVEQRAQAVTLRKDLRDMVHVEGSPV